MSHDPRFPYLLQAHVLVQQANNPSRTTTLVTIYSYIPTLGSLQQTVHNSKYVAC